MRSQTNNAREDFRRLNMDSLPPKCIEINDELEETYNEIKKELGSEVCLIAVSKGQPKQKIMSLYNAGHRDFGENFLQELIEKRCKLPDDIRWHFLGNIQSNKLPKIVQSSYIIHSISRHKIYELLINKKRANISTKILLQLKIRIRRNKKRERK